MAMQYGNTAAAGNNNNNNNEAKWKKDGFVNLYLPKKNRDGSDGQYKLGAIGLSRKNPTEAKILDMLEKDPDAAVKAIAEKLVIKYNAATQAAAELLI
jgi:hypothetical protein